MKKNNKVEQNVDLNQGSEFDLVNKTELELKVEQLENNNEVLIERVMILEWFVYGIEYKGKYKYHQFEEDAMIFGTSIDNLARVQTNDPKVAYLNFTKDDKN